MTASKLLRYIQLIFFGKLSILCRMRLITVDGIYYNKVNKQVISTYQTDEKV
jgi:hypothetical protein